MFGGPVAAVFAGTYTALVARSVLAARTAGRARRAASAVDDFVGGLADDLRAGLPPGAALSAGVAALADAEGLAGGSASGPSAALQPVTHAAVTGEDVPTALRRCTVTGAGTALAHLAAAWQVADTSGAPLADVLARVEADLSALRHRRDLLSSEVAASMVTVRMLAVLPVVGIGVGYTLGGDPLQFLLRTSEGAVCALLALLLQVSGLLWAERVTAAPGRLGST
jgi:tight adherence protein B